MEKKVNVYLNIFRISSKWADKFGNAFKSSDVCISPLQERLHAEYGCWCVFCFGNVKHLYILLKANCGG